MIVGESRSERRQRTLAGDECWKRSDREYIDEFTTTEPRTIRKNSGVQKLSDKFLWFSEVGSCFRFEGKV